MKCVVAVCNRYDIKFYRYTDSIESFIMALCPDHFIDTSDRMEVSEVTEDEYLAQEVFDD